MRTIKNSLAIVVMMVLTASLTSCDVAMMALCALTTPVGTNLDYTGNTYGATPTYTSYTGSSYSSSSSSSSSTTRSSSSTSSRKCVFCDGTGKVYKELHVATFGLDTTKEYCSICQKSTSTKHAHINCTNCHGTGYVKY